MTNDEFSGGEHGAKGKLEQLGFDVVPRPALALTCHARRESQPPGCREEALQRQLVPPM